MDSLSIQWALKFSTQICILKLSAAAFVEISTKFEKKKSDTIIHWQYFAIQSLVVVFVRKNGSGRTRRLPNMQIGHQLSRGKIIMEPFYLQAAIAAFFFCQPYCRLGEVGGISKCARGNERTYRPPNTVRPCTLQHVL